uniref:Uncharacterized protein n=1 Tax=Hyaloperonospora arabidopsidis (strain Emoy2) TaxID=559515 RepID=M4BH06_HYAAE
MPEVQPPTTLSPFSERDDANALLAPHSTPGSDDVIITNLLDEQQKLTVQRDESARRHAQMATTLENQRDYVFTPLSVEERLSQTTNQTLAAWTIGPGATSPEEVASGQARREKYLEPYLKTRSQYKARLEMQARGAPFPPIKCIPILLFAGETTDEKDDAFVRRVHRTRCLSSMYALRASANVADVRLECKLRYDYAKIKARDQLRICTRYASATTIAASAGQTVTTNPPTHTTSGGKRHLSQDDPGHDVQKNIQGIWGIMPKGYLVLP